MSFRILGLIQIRDIMHTSGPFSLNREYYTPRKRSKMKKPRNFHPLFSTLTVHSASNDVPRNRCSQFNFEVLHQTKEEDEGAMIRWHRSVVTVVSSLHRHRAFIPLLLRVQVNLALKQNTMYMRFSLSGTILIHN